jgi:hypothetical protein
MDQQLGRPVLIEFWDFCRPNSLRTLPYLRAWHERYAADGLRVIGVHSPGFPPSADAGAVRAAVARLEIAYPVVIDSALAVWELYENAGWPARYLFDRSLTLVDFHYGEGAYAETDQRIGELLGIDREPVPPLRPEDAAHAVVAPQTPDQPGAYAGPYAAGAVWAVVDGEGELRVGGRTIPVRGPGAIPLVEHERHTEGVLDFEISGDVEVYATCFTPGVV